MKDSGWNWMPSTGYSRWRTPMITPSSVRALTSRQDGKSLLQDGQGMVACRLHGAGQTREDTAAVVVICEVLPCMT